jgi:hypothetical protein
MQVVGDALTLNFNSPRSAGEFLFEECEPNPIKIRPTSHLVATRKAFATRHFLERWRLPHDWGQIGRKPLNECEFAPDVKIFRVAGGHLNNLSDDLALYAAIYPAAAAAVAKNGFVATHPRAAGDLDWPRALPLLHRAGIVRPGPTVERVSFWFSRRPSGTAAWSRTSI